MHEVFNFKRFTRLFVKHTVDHYRNYLMSTGVLLGVMLLGGSFITYLFPGAMDENLQWTLFGGILLLAGTIFTSTVFSEYGDKSKSVSHLLLPATAFEKFMVGWIYSYLIFTLVYTLLFYLVMVAILYIQQSRGFDTAIELRNEDKNYLLLMIYSLLHALSIYGAVLFDRLHFIKMAFVFFISYGVLIVINTFYLSFLISGKAFPAIPFGPLAFSQGETVYTVGLPIGQIRWVIIVICAVAVLFWAAAYVRLKEKRL